MDSAGIGKGVLIATLGTVAGGVVLQHLGYLSMVGHWIAETFVWLWHALTFPLPVPASVVVIFAAAFLYLFRRARRRSIAATSTGHRPSSIGPLVAADSFESQDVPVKAVPIATGGPAPLTDNELAVVRLLTDVDGAWMTIHQIAPRVRLRNYVTEQALDRLVSRHFLVSSVGGAGRVYRLSPTGRDFAIAQGFANMAPRGIAR